MYTWMLYRVMRISPTWKAASLVVSSRRGWGVFPASTQDSFVKLFSIDCVWYHSSVGIAWSVGFGCSLSVFSHSLAHTLIHARKVSRTHKYTPGAPHIEIEQLTSNLSRPATKIILFWVHSISPRTTTLWTIWQLGKVTVLHWSGKLVLVVVLVGNVVPTVISLPTDSFLGIKQKTVYLFRFVAVLAVVLASKRSVVCVYF